MSRILFELNELVRACYPKDQQEALDLWHDIKPQRFGSFLNWAAAQEYVLAGYTIPDDAAYLVVTRVDCYVTTNVATAAGFGLYAPVPPGAPDFTMRWVSAPSVPPSTADLNATGQEYTHILADVDEFLFFKGGNEISLRADFAANPTADVRQVRTLVYAYLLGPRVGDKLGSGEVLSLSFP